MMRAAAGIASPRRRSGYPVPSKRSWVARTIPATGTSAGAAAMMCSPITVWRWTNSHSAGSRLPGSPTIASGIAALPTSRQRVGGQTYLLRGLVGEAHPAGGQLAQVRDALHVLEQVVGRAR